MSDIKICLFNPVYTPTYPPLNLTCLSSYLKKYGKYSYEIRLVDVNCTKDPIEEIVAFNPDIIGFTCLSSHIVDAYNYSAEIKMRKSTILQICGGPHATICAKEMLLKTTFDIIVIGEGEVTFQVFVDGFIENQKTITNSFLLSVCGIAFKTDHQVHINPPRKIIAELDNLPQPDRSLLNMEFYNRRYYIMRGMSTNGVCTISASRGCPFNCIFCCVNFITKSKVRYRSPENVINEMETLVSVYGAKWFFFTDDTFLVNKKHTRELCEGIINKGLNKKIRWEVQVRSNLVTEKDFDLLKLMKRAGCEQFDYGFESGNQRVLTLIKGNGITIEDHQRALYFTKKAKIKVMATFILGTPTETYEEMLDTKDFILKNYSLIHRFQVGCMTPYPGTELYRLCMEKGLISEDYYTEIEREKRIKGEHGMQVYSDTVSHSKVIALRKELDILSFKKISTYTKFKWVVYNIIYDSKTALNGLNWLFDRLVSKLIVSQNINSIIGNSQLKK